MEFLCIVRIVQILFCILYYRLVAQVGIAAISLFGRPWEQRRKLINSAEFLGRLLKSDKLSPIAESLGFSMLILKNLNQKLGCSLWDVHRLFVPLASPVARMPAEKKRERKRTPKFRKSREIYSGTGWLFYPIPRIQVLSGHLRSSHPRGNFILGFRIFLIPRHLDPFFPLFGLKDAALDLSRHSPYSFGKPRDLSDA